MKLGKGKIGRVRDWARPRVAQHSPNRGGKKIPMDEKREKRAH
jgi:hypothetical protein